MRETFFLVLSAVVLFVLSPFKKIMKNRKKIAFSGVEKWSFFIKEAF